MPFFQGVGSYQISIRQFLDLVKKNIIVPYEYNRGGTPIKHGQVDSIATHFNIYALGELVIAKTAINKYIMADFHHRRAALELMRDRGILNKHLSDVFTCRVIPKEEFLKVYELIHNSHSHTAREDLLTKGFQVGKVLRRILSKTAFKTWNTERKHGLSAKFSVNLAMVAYGMSKNLPMRYVWLIQKRRIVAACRRWTSKNPIPLTVEKEVMIVNAVNYYESFIKHLVMMSGKGTLGQTTKGVLRNATFFGLIVSDYLNGHQVTHYSPKELALVVKKNDVGVANHIANMSQGDEDNQTKLVNDLMYILNRGLHGGTRRRNLIRKKYLLVA